MPTNVVDVDLSTETGAIAQPTYSDLLVVAREATIADPTYNEPRVYDSATQVSSDFGSDSDAHVAAREIEEMGARQFWVIMLETEEHDETLGNSDTESTSEETISNTPLRGGVDNITVEVDGDEMDVVPSVGSPPDAPDTGEVAVNFDTGEVTLSDPTSGDGPGIEVSYETLNWGDATVEMTAGDFDITIVADTRADRSYIGELDELLSWASSNDATVVAAWGNGNNYDSDEDAMEAAHETGGYLTSGDIFPVAHKSNDDVAAGIAGRLSTKRPWFNPFMDGGADYGFSMENYRRALIGSPDEPGTFEGGDSDGAGPTNVLYREGGVQILSNSLSTAGRDSAYQFFDVSRTESFIVSEVKRALRSLRLNRESIPFAPIGRTLIRAKLRERLNAYVAPSGRQLSPDEISRLTQRSEDDDEDPLLTGEPPRHTSGQRADVPLSRVEIQVPRYDDLDQTDRANRVWTGIHIEATLAGNVHTFSVDLAVRV